MAISYPLEFPCTIGVGGVRVRPINAVGADMSPMTFDQTVYAWPGQRWQADVSLPSHWSEDRMRPWTGFLTALRGQVGTFLMPVPHARTPRGTATACTVTGVAGDSSVSVVMTGTLLSGDYIQLGSGSGARLHMVLQDQDGSGVLEIWPALRVDRGGVAAVLNNPQGVFRLARNFTEWEIDVAGIYGLSFSANEVI